MKQYSAQQIREADQQAIASGTPGKVLMGRASKALASELNFFAEGRPRPILILAGPGNNGGDGFGLATHLLRLGWTVWVWVAGKPSQIKGDARLYLDKLSATGCEILWKPEGSDWEEASLDIPPGTWLVDALLGTGIQEAPRGAPKAAIRLLAGASDSHRVWSIDLPSGLNADTGIPYEESCCVRANTTLTLGAPKRGLSVDHALAWTGSVAVLDIGVDLSGHEADPDWQVLSDRELREALPLQQAEAHKGSRGHLLFVGGSPGMSGSISMSAFAALRSGAGLTSVLAPFSVSMGIDSFQPEIMVIAGQQGRFMTLNSQTVPFDSYRSVCVGPGLRVNPDTQELLRRILQECPHPLVLDADALNGLAPIQYPLGDKNRPVFLTPHPGEMSRLLQRKTKDVQADRCQAVQDAVDQSQAYVVLKGARSRIAGPDGRSWVNLSGNEALATAGTGDVLAGIVTACIGRGVSLDRVLPVAVSLHGKAGELASIRKGTHSVVASDVLEALPSVFAYIEEG